MNDTSFVNIKTLSCHDPLWSRFIKSHSGSSIFHHPQWLLTLQKAYKYKAFITGVIKKDMSLAAGIPIVEIDSALTGKRWVSTPFSDHCLPLGENDNYLRQLFEYLNIQGHKKKLKYIEIKEDISTYLDANKMTPCLRHQVTLQKNPDEVFRRFKVTQTQQRIKKSIREGVTVQIAKDETALGNFYKLHVATRKKVGTPVQPMRFFKALYENIIQNNLGFIGIASYQGQPIAAAVFLIYKKTITYKYSASSQSHLNLHPNNILIWEIMKWACLQGYEHFDMGKTSVHNHGLSFFKKGFGAEERVINYSFLSEGVLKNNDSRPGFIEKMSSKIIRISPTYICRLSGELLYRHYG